ncbi:ribonuclease P protein component [Methylobacterium sp. J-068]|uniref:ribonuclease P protein component n=1 Tax=Methylobacterium sp. J-068 TaxID=2836649 RepID=UPI001FB9FCE2|nr:ribonuclease P protein component [Methylobacterium sp. J-068]MCJ2036659.1 ribonuclease P protein component [Methylobacterium sp. J-068]
MSRIGRLTRRSEFLAAAGGRRFHNERLSAQGLVRAGDGSNPDAPDGLRIGFTITKRVGHATERNRIRRRLRAAVAEAAGDLPVRAADVVLVARRPALHAPFETLIDDLRRAVAVVTKPQTTRSTDAGSAPSSGRGRGKRAATSSGAPKSSASPKSGISAAAPVLASGATASAATPGPERSGSGPALASAPSPPSNACDGPTDG